MEEVLKEAKERDEELRAESSGAGKLKTEDLVIESKNFFSSYKKQIGRSIREGHNVIFINFDDLASFSHILSEELLAYLSNEQCNEIELKYFGVAEYNDGAIIFPDVTSDPKIPRKYYDSVFISEFEKRVGKPRPFTLSQIVRRLKDNRHRSNLKKILSGYTDAKSYNN